MESEFQKIEDYITLEILGGDRFRSQNLMPHFMLLQPGVNGGQLVAHSLRAAYYTVDQEYRVHSLHSYFLYPATTDAPIFYEVNRERDGKKYITRVVKASQNGRKIFNLACSFSKKQRGEFNHEYKIPSVPDPDTLMSEEDRAKSAAKNPKCTPLSRMVLETMYQKPYRPIDFRVTYSNPDEGIFLPMTKSNHRYVWFRMRGKLTDDPVVHECALAYASDEEYLYTACIPLGIAFNTDPYITALASLDHIIYFHDEFRADEWLLIESESPLLKNTRGLVLGRIYRQNGTLVASVVQEGVVGLKRGNLEEDIMKDSKI
ncbi:uncharacterized protein VTP21DRAFT_9708 [Calcarisporiella thermophila]|uniref:uncharacterized protein n=1 Tax=Calcarisporiella thermophila TaxID=911321 RepID=UPI003742AD17